MLTRRSVLVLVYVFISVLFATFVVWITIAIRDNAVNDAVAARGEQCRGEVEARDKACRDEVAVLTKAHSDEMAAQDKTCRDAVAAAQDQACSDVDAGASVGWKVARIVFRWSMTAIRYYRDPNTTVFPPTWRDMRDAVGAGPVSCEIADWSSTPVAGCVWRWTECKTEHKIVTMLLRIGLPLEVRPDSAIVLIESIDGESFDIL